MSWEDAELFFDSNPDLKYVQTYQYPSFPTARQDKEELPFKDLRVRQAMNMAVNQQEILDDYYEGNAELLGWPYYPCASHQYLYVPLEDMSETAQELYEYHPDKAKELLAEAGYPNGFKTQIDCLNTQVDLVSIIREYLLDVGIDMKINVLEPGVFNSVDRGRKHEEMIMKSPKMAAHTFRMHEVRKESFDNLSFYDNPRTRAVYIEMNKLLGYDDQAWMALVKEIVPFMVEECVMGIWLPVPYAYNMWWPWVKNFRGETDIGFFTPNKMATYIWIDQELKKSMGY